MRKFIKATIVIAYVLAAAGLVFSGEPSGAPAEKEKYELTYKFQKGDSFAVTVFLSQNISQTVSGVKQEMEQEIDIEYSFDITGVDNQGNYDTKITYKTVKASQSGVRGMDYEYDSSRSTKNPPRGAVAFNALVGKSITGKMTKNGRYLDLKGVDAILDDIVDDVAKMSGPNFDEKKTRELLKKQFGEKAMTQNLNQGMPIFPDNAVSVGDTWVNRLYLSQVFGMETTFNCTLKSVTEDSFVVEVTADIKSDGQGEGLDMGSGVARFACKGEMTGQLKISRATGLPIAATFDSEYSGTVRMEPRDPATYNGPTEWPTEVKSATTTRAKLEERESEDSKSSD